MAGIHSGHADNEKGGSFRVKIANGEDLYDSTEQNGVIS